MIVREESRTTPDAAVSLQVESAEVVRATHPAVEQPIEERTTLNGRVRVVLPVKEVKPVVDESLEPIQEWEGVVDWVEGDRFGARLSDITEAGEVEYTDFTLDEISEDDLDLVVPGGVFYWTVARETGRLGQRRHVSMLRFRRLPIVRAARRLDVRQEADRIADELGIGSDTAKAAG